MKGLQALLCVLLLVLAGTAAGSSHTEEEGADGQETDSDGTDDASRAEQGNASRQDTGNASRSDSGNASRPDRDGSGQGPAGEEGRNGTSDDRSDDRGRPDAPGHSRQGAVAVAVEPAVLRVAPGSQEETTVRVHADETVQVHFFVRGSPVGWQATLGSEELEVEAGSSATAQLMVNASHRAAPEGNLVLGYRASSGDRGSIVVDLSLERPDTGPAVPCPRLGDGACCPAAQDRCPGPALRPQHVSLTPRSDALGFEDHQVGGLPVLESVLYEPLEPGAVGEVEADGARLRFHLGTEGRLVVTDNPTGLLRFSGPGDLALRFAGDVEWHEQGDAWRASGDGWEALLWADNLTLDGRDAVASGSLGFHLLPPQERPAADPSLRDAVAKRHVGAEVSLRPESPAQVLSYEDMAVNVSMPVERATADDPIRVEVDAHLDTGRTIVLDIDPALLVGDELLLRYFDVTYEGGERQEAEVVFTQADSLADVLDPNDDGIQPEYWVVRDADGVHVLVSVPAWSVHAFTVSGVADVVLQPSVLVGLAAGVVGSVLAAAALLWPRRRQDLLA